MANQRPDDGTTEGELVGIPLSKIQDYELLRCIGSGSYGEVWLARSLMGTYRAIKIIYRKTFADGRPFEREFAGLKRFEPISRSHVGWVHILHVGRDEAAGFFYYVMEAADDVGRGQSIDPEDYTPKTLGIELAKRGKIPLDETLRLGLSLAAALGQLHSRGLIHRDVKPSNIIFVNNVPKLADIGLVTTIGEATTFVGTEGYVPPEGPGSPAADLYSLGKLLYETCMGKDSKQFPELPTNLGETSDAQRLMRLNDVILRACDLNPRRRFNSAQEMYEQIHKLLPDERAPATALFDPTAVPAPSKSSPLTDRTSIAILYKSNVQPDGQVVNLLQEEITRQGCQVFIDRHMTIGVEWARQIEYRIRQADAVIVLLSGASIQSEMIAYEIEVAHEAAQQLGRPRLLPVRIQFASPLPNQLARLLDSLHYFLWQGPQDNQRLVSELLRALRSPDELVPPAEPSQLESVGGAVPLDSKFYVVRPADYEFRSAIVRRDSIVLVRGARQMGKTSLLARGLQQARGQGVRVVLTDFQELNASDFVSLEKFYLALGDSLADQLELDVSPGQAWEGHRSPNTNFDRYLRREVLGKVDAQVVWGLDEVDRLFTCNFGGEVFGMFRSWHNKRALDPHGPWARLTLAIAYATEAHLFITDLNQSPFNVGTRLTLEDFQADQVADLNRRYGSPLQNQEQLARFADLVNGQPFLVRRGLHELATQDISFDAFATQADRDEGLFGDHLRRILVSLVKDRTLLEVMRGVLQGHRQPDSESFYRLRSAGVMAGDSAADARLRCQVYANYLKRHLL